MNNKEGEARSRGGNKARTFAGKVHTQGEAEPTSLTVEQVQQLLSLIPSGSKASREGYTTEDEIETGFAGMILCNHVYSEPYSWIIDSGATDHMICDFQNL